MVPPCRLKPCPVSLRINVEGHERPQADGNPIWDCAGSFAAPCAHRFRQHCSTAHDQHFHITPGTFECLYVHPLQHQREQGEHSAHKGRVENNTWDPPCTKNGSYRPQKFHISSS